MRYLTPEENARKRNMYRKMSEPIDEAEFAKKPKYCEGMECKNCYRHLQCWACKKADLENMRTCGRSAKEKTDDCFECNINEE